MHGTMRLFLKSVDSDYQRLEQLNASKTILSLLRGMLDSVRSQWAVICSDEKNNKEEDYSEKLEKYLTLNTDVNETYNKIVEEREAHLTKSGEEIQEIDQFILAELFQSYTIFLDAYSEMNFYYQVCGNFPWHMLMFYNSMKSARQANKIISEKERGG